MPIRMFACPVTNLGYAPWQARLGIFMSPGADATKILESQFFKRIHATQLNEAEYAPIIFAGLAFLFSKGVMAPTASALMLGGQVTLFYGFRPI